MRACLLTLPFLLLLLFSRMFAFAADPPAASPIPPIAPPAPISAFDAVGLLPPGVSRRIAIIEGRDGNPQPERWYLVAYDPNAEHRLMEYVVASNRLVAVHPVSQFAQELSLEEILPLDSSLMNSDRVLQIAELFARANNLRLPRINMRLKKEGAGAAPLWKVTCLDDSSSPFAGILIAANGGIVLQTQGFQLSPDSFSPIPPQPSKPAPAAVAQHEEPRSVEARAAEPKGNARKRQGTTQAASPQKRNRAKAESRRQTKPEPVAEQEVGVRQFFHNLVQHRG